ncbi:MAG TPA: hypothetical protein VMS21_05355, partial [Methylomirabilota bacterium]|nr:hypothetical protein [Methylomirabilota bacterium]
AYPFPNLDIDTVFGKGGLSRVRVRPDGQFAYAFDEPGASTVYAFDVAKGELAAELTLPTVSGMQVAVTDVAFFTAKGKPRVLVAASGNAGSVLVQYDSANHKPVANGQTILQGKKITRLAGTPLDTRHLYAAVKREGLFRFNPESFGIADFRQPMAAFNATGHLDVAGPFACATAASSDVQTETDTYDRIALIRIGNEQADAQFISLNDPDGHRATGTDGLSMVFSAARTGIRLSRRAAAGDFSQGAFAYVTVNAKVNQTQKRLLAVDLLRGTVNAEIPLGTSGPVRSAPDFNHSFLMVSLAEDFRMLWIDPRTNKVSPAQSLPLQMYPLDLATAPAGRQSMVIAANRVSNTLTLIPGRHIGAEAPLDVSALETYRDNLLAAFFQLLLRLGQQVKDCLCDHLLVDCPVCEDNDLIVLACIEIKTGQVHHVCNFSRHEVITFPKLKYWLSAVPVIPFVTWGIEKFCCIILSELFADATKGRNDLVSSRTLGAATERANLVRFSAAASEQLGRMRLLGGHVFESSRAKAVARPAAAAESGVRTAEVLHLSPDAATRTLSDSGVEVARVAEYDEALGGSAIKDIRDVPTRVQPGEKLNLFTREGKVVFYTIAREEPAVVVGTARAEARPSAGGTVAPAATRDEMAALKVELDALKKSHKAELAARDKELAALKASATAMKTDLTKLKRARGGTTGRTRG